MREGNTQGHSERQHAPLGRERPGGESRLPAAIVPPPGLGKIICMRKICKKFDARSMQVYFLQNTALKNEFPPKRAKMKPRGSKITQTWPYMAPKGTQFEPKGYQNDPKGCQRGAKSEPEINKNTTKDRNLEKGRKRGGACNIFWD